MWVRVPPGLLKIKPSAGGPRGVSIRPERPGCEPTSTGGRVHGAAAAPANANRTGNETRPVNFFRNIAKFFTDVISEFKRVTWPTREATLKSTGVVLVLTIAVALFLGVIDVGLSESVKLIIR